MKRVLIALVCLFFVMPAFAQNADDPASSDDVILLLRTMHSHDLIQRTMAAELASMRQILHDQFVKGGTASPEVEARISKSMDDLVKGMPMDEIVQAMIPAYQKHFTHGDIEAMNTFYASPVGQKVLEQMPTVMQEGMQDAMPIMSKYLDTWQEKTKKGIQPAHPAKTGGSAPQAQN
jgi:hypothetical protein